MSIHLPRRRGTVLAGSVLAVALVTGGWSVATPTTQASPKTAPTAQQALTDQLDAILADPRLSGAEAGLTVRNADTGQSLYDANGNERLLPASNAKVYTTSAAMDLLGPDYRFDTKVLRSGKVVGHTLLGNLYLKGFGDPTSTTTDYDTLAGQVASTGIRYISGALVADDSFFDSTRLAPFWSWDDEPYYYSAQTSALNISPDDIGDTGTVLIEVFPGARAGDRPRITMTPPNNDVHLVVHATTGAAGSASTMDATREYGKNIVDVTGSIPVGAANYASQPSVDQPTGLAADVFRAALGRHGVQLSRRPTAYSTTPTAAITLASHQSQPLTRLLVPLLKLSNNMMAEAFTKAIGQQASGQGSWAAGTAAILADVARNGVDPSTLQLFDGSGLGRADYVTTDQTTNLLIALRAKPWFQSWYDALPIAGNPAQLVGGTLRNRLTNTAAANNLHGKTGSMTGVSALSGYLTDAGGQRLVFAMMSNNFVRGGISHLEDAVALALANYGGNGTAAAIVQPAQSTPADRDRRGQLECSWTRSC